MQLQHCPEMFCFRLALQVGSVMMIVEFVLVHTDLPNIPDKMFTACSKLIDNLIRQAVRTVNLLTACYQTYYKMQDFEIQASRTEKLHCYLNI
jgi:hypothetical protein